MAEQSWTDDPITAGATRIRKKPIHFTELQDAINAWESAYAAGPGVDGAPTEWTDSPATGVKITSTAITEMQDAINDLIILVGQGSQSWTEASASKTIKPVHINELRNDMNGLQDKYCYQCDSCDTDIGCDCDNACDEDVCSQCDSSCYGYSGCSLCHGTWHNYCGAKDYTCACNGACYTGYSACTCNSDCNVDGCDLCDTSCNGDTCTHCNASIYRYPWT